MPKEKEIEVPKVEVPEIEVPMVVVAVDAEIQYDTEIMVCGYCNGQRGTVNEDVYTCKFCKTETPLT